MHTYLDILTYSRLRKLQGTFDSPAMGSHQGVCVCVCVCERERDTEKETDREREREVGGGEGTLISSSDSAIPHSGIYNINGVVILAPVVVCANIAFTQSTHELYDRRGLTGGRGNGIQVSHSALVLYPPLPPPRQ